MSLRKGWEILALLLQEAADGMTHSEVRQRLNDAVKAAHPDKWRACYVDHTGDGNTGTCMYEDGDGKLQAAPYTTETLNGKLHTNLDTSKAKPKHAMVQYIDVASDEDNYTSMEAAGLYEAGAGKYIERFISKDERAKMAPEDFAGKGRSFPISSPEDVTAALHSVGRAGPGNHAKSTIHKNIIAIAKRKGGAFMARIPDEDKECATSGNMNSTGGAMEGLRDVDITGDCVALKEGAVGQDGSAYLKLISPGWGSSGYYSPELLERDGPKCFKAGTKSFWNHPTDAEEAARPEGDLRDFASVLTEDAKYLANGPAGAGLYARAKVNEQFRQPVDDLAKHIGVSIRATGKAKEGTAAGRTGPIIQELNRGISVDYVTTPGAGGQILQLFEAARGSKPTNSGETEMNETEARALRESNQNLAAEVKKLKERESLREAGGVIAGFFKDVNVPENIQKRVTAHLLERALPVTAATGELDTTKLKTIWEAELKDEITFVNETAGRKVVADMGGAPQAAQLTEAQRTEMKEREKEESREFAGMFGFGKQNKMARRIMREGRAAFDPEYNSAEKNVNGVNTLVGMEA